MPIDWYSWLSKTCLEPSLVYEYAFVFSQNELEEEDIKHLDHEFLGSMGISIAKHRLEILKLAKKEKRVRPDPVSRLLAALKKTKKCLAKYICKLVHSEDSALVVVPRNSYGKRWRGSMLKRNNKRVVVLKQGRLMLTDGSVKIAGLPSHQAYLSHSASPIIYDLQGSSKVDDAYWGEDAQEIRWDSMFQDMKPT